MNIPLGPGSEFLGSWGYEFDRNGRRQVVKVCRKFGWKKVVGLGKWKIQPMLYVELFFLFGNLGFFLAFCVIDPMNRRSKLLFEITITFFIPFVEHYWWMTPIRLRAESEFATDPWGNWVYASRSNAKNQAKRENDNMVSPTLESLGKSHLVEDCNREKSCQIDLEFNSTSQSISVVFTLKSCEG